MRFDRIVKEQGTATEIPNTVQDLVKLLSLKVASRASDLGSMPFPATRDDSGDHCMQATKGCRRRSIHPDFETHGQSHPKSETEGTSGPAKWTSSNKTSKKKNF